MIPWKHQLQAMEFAQGRRGTLLAHGMASGKTYSALLIASLVKAKTILVLSPVSVIDGWAAEARKCFGRDVDVVELVKGTVAKKTDQARLALARAGAVDKPVILILGHEASWRPPFAQLALSTLWDLVVIDEGHKLQAAGGKFGRFAAKLALVAKKRLALTGTPFPNGPLSIYGLARFVDPTVFGTNYAKMRNRYAICTLDDWGVMRVDDYQRMDEFRQRYLTFAHEVRTDDVIDLPAEIDMDRRVDLEPSAMSHYRRIKQEMFTEIDQGFLTVANGAVKVGRLAQITGGHLPLNSDEEGEVVRISWAKQEALEDLIESTDEPVVVFTRFRAELDIVEEVATKLKRRYGEVSGRRKDLVDSKMPDTVDVMGVHPRAGGVGVDLKRAAICVFYSHSYSLTDYEQARARIRRPGQTRPCRYYAILAKGTVDLTVQRALAAKKDVLVALFAGKLGVEEC